MYICHRYRNYFLFYQIYFSKKTKNIQGLLFMIKTVKEENRIGRSYFKNIVQLAFLLHRQSCNPSNYFFSDKQLTSQSLFIHENLGYTIIKHLSYSYNYKLHYSPIYILYRSEHIGYTYIDNVEERIKDNYAVRHTIGIQ